jgi:signal transduction histidine kinase
MEALGNLAGGTAHDMNNVLAVVLALSTNLERDSRLPAHVTAEIAALTEAARRGRALVQDLLRFTHGDELKPKPVRVANILESVRASMSRLISPNISIRLDAESNATVSGDEEQLYRTFMNVSINAADALGERGNITLRLSEVDVAEHDMLPPGRYVRVEVLDDGPGMDRVTRHRAIEPFFTTKSTGAGSGLGLAMAYRTIERHRGTLTLESELGRGTSVVFLIPACQSVKPSESAALRETEGGEVSGLRVLLVDDDDLVRNACATIL